MGKELLERARAGFKRSYPDCTGRAVMVRAPGRVNLIGEHTDYNDGYVLPAAIERETVMAGAARDDRTVRVAALDLDRRASFGLDSLERSAGDESGVNYIKGVAAVLESQGRRLRGMDAVIASDIPIGSGLSSSAALEVAAARLWSELDALEMEPVELALAAQQAENEFVGMRCGIMDQMASVLGREGHAVFLDCRTREYRLVPLPSQRALIVICDSGVRRELSASEYNRRREQCEQAVESLRRLSPGIRALRDVDTETLASARGLLDPLLFLRARHVVSENERVLASVEALQHGDLGRFGGLMNASHDSLRDDYEVSCRELDVLVEAARGVPGVLGSRLTGAGFGGCTVSLVEDSAVEGFAADVASHYRRETGRDMGRIVTGAAEGAGRVEE